jgi:hypothetical protein
MEQSLRHDPPLTVWIITLNREVHQEVCRAHFSRRFSPEHPCATPRNTPYVPDISIPNHRRRRRSTRIATSHSVSTARATSSLRLLSPGRRHIGYVIAKLLPSLVMRNRHVPPSQWHYSSTSSGKDYIVSCTKRCPPVHSLIGSRSFKDSPNASKVLGYNTAWAESVVAMAFAHGRKSQVVNIGIDMMQLVLPRGVPAHKYVEAFAHKVRIWRRTLPSSSD